MGTDIHSFVETRINGKWQVVAEIYPFDNRNYSIYAFISGVRNLDCCTPITERRGLPTDSEYLNTSIIGQSFSEFISLTPSMTALEYLSDGFYGHGYLTLSELLNYDYDIEFYNMRRCITITYRDNLGDEFFQELDKLKSLGEPDDVRVVFMFN